MCTDYYENERLSQKPPGIVIKQTGWNEHESGNEMRKCDIHASNNKFNEKQRDRGRLHITHNYIICITCRTYNMCASVSVVRACKSHFGYEWTTSDSFTANASKPKKKKTKVCWNDLLFFFFRWRCMDQCWLCHETKISICSLFSLFQF